MIDLHLHTTASDGRSTPEGLVQEAAAAGVTTLAVTDHDTLAAVADVRAAAVAAGLACVPGIEVTAIHAGRDVHILGYFIDEDSDEFNAFLTEQRRDRQRRVVEMAARLAELGAPIDIALASAGADRGRAIGRPFVAAALVAAGHATDVSDAFDRFLGHGRPAFIARRGATPADVVRRIARAGGVSSLAHPGKLGQDDIIPELVRDGLAAIEVFHPDHTEADTERYVALGARLGLLVTGGSDYHGPGSGRSASLGHVGLPSDAYAALVQRARAERRG